MIRPTTQGVHVQELTFSVCAEARQQRQISNSSGTSSSSKHNGSPKHQVSFLKDLLEDVGDKHKQHEEGGEADTGKDPFFPMDLQMRRQDTDELSWHVPSLTACGRQETEQIWPSWGGDALPHTIDLSMLDLEDTAAEHGPVQEESNPGCNWSNMWMLPMLDKPEFAVHQDESETLQEADTPKGKHETNGSYVSPNSEWDRISTVMLRNIPNKYTQSMLLEELKMSGFLGTYDFLYLPIDPETNANRGYAFINFTNPAFAWMLRTTYEGRKMCRFNSDKVVSVAPAALQGFEANYAHYSSARVNRGDPAVRPLFLRESVMKNVTNNKQDVNRRRGGRRGSSSLIDMAARQQQHLPQPPVYNAAALHAFPALSALGGCQPAATDEAKGQPPPRFCPFCGGNCKPEFRFCQFCGSALTMKGL
mmetsp:Transcript_123428/g.240196  ORF Transcript_123428/g.240196 Transcript_123428/m.240196 type:complete len:420 (+) Transcript_123428:107-1366(+)